MRLIEKKCPNCGATLEFSENDKSCHCQYCKRSFEIERDLNDVEKFNLIYDKIQKPVKTFFFVPFIFAFVIILMISISIFFSIRNQIKDENSSIKNNTNTQAEENTQEEENLLTDVSLLSNSDFDSIDNHAKSEINRSGEGVNDSHHSYSINGKVKREKLYIAYQKGHNYVIPIYKATYYDFFHQENQYTVYIPILFENIEKNVTFSLGNPTLKAPEYYFNDDHSSYTYGYSSLEDAYQEIIKPLENDGYTISEK